MKTLAVIKNELFKDYLKIISTDNLEEALDNPAVPVPFTCVLSVENQNSDTLSEELNRFFANKKLPKKDFLSVTEQDIEHMSFIFNLIKISGGQNPEPIVQKTQVKAKDTVNVEVKGSVKVAEPVIAEVAPEKLEETSTVVESEVEKNVTDEDLPIFDAELEEQPTVSGDLIDSLGVPVNATIHLVKDEKVTAKIIDEKTIEFEGEVIAIVDGTKKAFKKAGVTGMALGLANWNYNGQSLKSLKDNK